MATLTIALNAVPLDRIALRQPHTTLGRRAYNDIVIDHLAVSGEHAVFVLHPDGVELIDLHSTNGSYVNGRAVDSARIGPDDRIEIGPYQLQVQFDAAPPPCEPSEPPAAALKARMRVLSAVASGKEMALIKAITTLGKPGLAVAAISQQGQRHCLAAIEGEAPLLNGRALGPEPVPLAHLDRITLAGVEMQYLLD